jgi:hypothetical protein
MKEQLPEQHRVTIENHERHRLRKEAVTDAGYGANGVFYLPRIGKALGSYYLLIISSGMGWEHISVSIPSEKRCPTWDEMCYVKNMFFNPDECVVQFHPAESQYVNNHKYCLHLWKPIGVEFPVPDKSMVGV